VVVERSGGRQVGRKKRKKKENREKKREKRKRRTSKKRRGIFKGWCGWWGSDARYFEL